jgi:N6-L-threonylcarbamoyladenine synthase
VNVLGIETSCDECAAAVVEDGRFIKSNAILTQIPFHARYEGVVPEIASRKHTEWILPVVKEALDSAGLSVEDIDAVAAVSQPGLFGSLLVGLTFAKSFAWARDLPFIACNHLLSHLYACRLESGGAGGFTGENPAYPFIGLLASGGHTVICRMDDFDRVTVLGSTIDDAAGEAFDKVAKHYKIGYPGGAAISALAKKGDCEAFKFPLPNLKKGFRRCDVSYSGLKTAAINQRDLFSKKLRDENEDIETLKADVAASFQEAAVEILIRSLLNAVEDTGITVIAAGGGVAANERLRERLAGCSGLKCFFPPFSLCGDNAAMTAGLGWRYLERGERSPLSTPANSRAPDFRRGF